MYGRTRAEVSKKLLEISGRIRSNSYEMIEGQTFGELMNEWLMVFKKSAVTPRTFRVLFEILNCTFNHKLAI